MPATTPPLLLLHRDASLVAVDKPAGRIVVPGRGAAAEEACLRDELAAQLGARVFVVHRLDRGTSGVLVFALTPEAHRAMSMAFERHEAVKRYLALCRGELIGSGEIARALVPIRGGKVRAARAGERAGKPSRTAWRAVERFAGLTWVEFRPHSGRLHQVRAHAALLGFPLAVDPDYAGAARLRLRDLDPNAAPPDAETIVVDRVTLHAASLRLPHPATGEPLEIAAPVPADLARAIDILRAARRKGR